ncbi:Hypothetical protein SMAX5B_001118 [Scophthalmus maximus]|uniref:Uncharacterized protein n=1 Tax=Scophthalmus maximus TaxID=52904 RepID=A0A2U9CF81_SCOMX|nr:Hypothetical protein SMAX5B_001118 [Scophthalmus maximus]
MAAGFTAQRNRVTPAIHPQRGRRWDIRIEKNKPDLATENESCRRRRGERKQAKKESDGKKTSEPRTDIPPLICRAEWTASPGALRKSTCVFSGVPLLQRLYHLEPLGATVD